MVVIAEMFEAVASGVRCAVACHYENGLTALAVYLIRESLVIERVELVRGRSDPNVIDAFTPTFERRQRFDTLDDFGIRESSHKFERLGHLCGLVARIEVLLLFTSSAGSLAAPAFKNTKTAIKGVVPLIAV